MRSARPVPRSTRRKPPPCIGTTSGPCDPADKSKQTLLGCMTALIGGINQHVSCELFDCKLIERFVFIKRADHPIAVTPGVRPELVPLKALALAEARKIESWKKLKFA